LGEKKFGIKTERLFNSISGGNEFGKQSLSPTTIVSAKKPHGANVADQIYVLGCST
jgi:hypothetical protein